MLTLDPPSPKAVGNLIFHEMVIDMTTTPSVSSHSRGDAYPRGGSAISPAILDECLIVILAPATLDWSLTLLGALAAVVHEEDMEEAGASAPSYTLWELLAYQDSAGDPSTFTVYLPTVHSKC